MQTIGAGDERTMVIGGQIRLTEMSDDGELMRYRIEAPPGVVLYRKVLVQGPMRYPRSFLRGDSPPQPA
jgi:hypothetical protein